MHRLGCPSKFFLYENEGEGSKLILREYGFKKTWKRTDNPLVRHILKDIGDRTSPGPFFSRSTISQHAFVWDAVFVSNQFCRLLGPFEEDPVVENLSDCLRIDLLRTHIFEVA